MNNVEREEIIKIFNTLNQIELRGYNNIGAMRMCMDTLKQLAENNTMEADDGNTNTES